jgi:hypothetical protein
MTVYAIVQFKIIDRTAYDRYQARFFDVLRKFSGRLLSADESPALLEGAWKSRQTGADVVPRRSGVSRLGGYLEISKDRKAGAETIVLLAKGFAPGG